MHRKPGKPPKPMAFAWGCGCPTSVNDIQQAQCPKCRKPKVNPVIKPRLPVGSKFSAEYVEDGVWQGILHTPEDAAPVFKATAKSVKSLCFALDDLYREWLEEQVAAS